MVSRERVEAVREAYAAFAQGEFGSHLRLFDPLVMFVPLQTFPGPLHYVGRKGITEYMRELFEATSEFRQHGEEFIDAGDSVIVAVHAEASGRESRTLTEMSYFAVWTFRGPAVIRLEHFEDRAEALAAVGLSQ